MSIIPSVRGSCRWPFAGLCALLLGGAAFAADVIVITDSRHALRVPAGVRVITLDEPGRIESELSQDLPDDPLRAAATVQQRLNTAGSALQRRIAASYQDVVDAWSLGIATIPAVVVDKRYVVYGEPDVAKAITRIEAYRREQP